MIKFRIIIVIMALLSGMGQQAYASSAPTSGVSCTGGISILNNLLANVTTLGLFNSIASNFLMYGDPNGLANPGAFGSNNQALMCDANYYNGAMHYPKTCVDNSGNPIPNCPQNCDNPNNVSPAPTCQACNAAGGVYLCYYNSVAGSMTWSCDWWQAGDPQVTYYDPPATLRVINVGDQLCAQFYTPIGWQSIGCKYLPDCNYFTLDSSCYVAQSCISSTSQYSHTPLPIAGTVVQCISDSVKLLFYQSASCTTNGQSSINYFKSFRDTLRNAVRSALMLYIILFGIKITLSGEVPSKGELFSFGAKFILVNYFSVGILVDRGAGGVPIYDDGIMDILYPLFNQGSSFLASLVYESGGSIGLCNYPANGMTYHEGYQYLALWDSIDCRIAHYLGFNQGATGALFY